MLGGWGILWRHVKFSLKNGIYVVDACMRLHNFIVDCHKEHQFGSCDMDTALFDEHCGRFLVTQSGVMNL